MLLLAWICPGSVREAQRGSVAFVPFNAHQNYANKRTLTRAEQLQSYDQSRAVW